MTQTSSTLILNALTDEMDDYSPEFMEEYGIIDLIELGGDYAGYTEFQLTFKDQQSKELFTETFDLP